MIFPEGSHRVDSSHTPCTEINTHPHTTHNPNTQAPPNCKKEKSLPCKRTQQHTCGLLTCSVDSSIFHWWREDTGHRVGREMSQKQHNSHGKKALVFFSPTDECRCQQSRVVEQNSGIECDGREGVKKRQVEWHTTNCVTIIVILLFKCTALFLVCLWIQQKAPLFLNQETSIRYDDYYTLDKNCKLCTVREAFPFFLQKLREGLLFIIFQYVFKMFSLLAVPGQVIPGGSESPFRAAGLRQCRAWNPITSAAMLALWHQTPSMQNATAGVYQQRAPQFSSCRGIHWWVARLTRGRRDDTVDTDEGQSGEQKKGVGVRMRTVEWGEKMLSLGCTSIVTAACTTEANTQRGEAIDVAGTKINI